MEISRSDVQPNALTHGSIRPFSHHKSILGNISLLCFLLAGPSLVPLYYFISEFAPWDQGEHDSYGVVENSNSKPVNLIPMLRT